MKGREKLPLVRTYLKRCRAVIAACVCGGILCASVFWLYRLPVEAVLYAVLLGVGVAVVVGVGGGRRGLLAFGEEVLQLQGDGVG